MTQIQIVNFLLTRKCNIDCHYCAITKNYKNKPYTYPDMKHYHQNEMSTEKVLHILYKLKIHNPNLFVIFYGGEPLLRKDLHIIINYCNNQQINYTIITNNTPQVQKSLKTLINNTECIQGITSSVDPQGIDKFSSLKSDHGFKKLIELKKTIPDAVAEITVSNENVPFLYDTVRALSDNGINSSITFIDIAKNVYYDFSNIYDSDMLVRKTPELEEQINKIVESNLDVHMKDSLLPIALDTLPSEFDCHLEDGIHNMTIDADGSVRLCLRIRGEHTPYLQADECFNEDGSISESYQFSISTDKYMYCDKCNWTCVMMSRLVSVIKNMNSLLHTDRRK